ncbi:hypothetical protein Pmani_025648 [Petrolisthes manimaculis]|uniref:Carotenoid isomerooxygenase n=1 Tax=Petrolisthes manimaculis TaxID=1843537 RepID=A0AAE1P6A9_9EUCA|nr:hypothetical protein Pmani_025648 [Petrolisthes manimaculis]
MTDIHINIDKEHIKEMNENFGSLVRVEGGGCLDTVQSHTTMDTENNKIVDVCLGSIMSDGECLDTVESHGIIDTDKIKIVVGCDESQLAKTYVDTTGGTTLSPGHGRVGSGVTNCVTSLEHETQSSPAFSQNTASSCPNSVEPSIPLGAQNVGGDKDSIYSDSIDNIYQEACGGDADKLNMNILETCNVNIPEVNSSLQTDVTPQNQDDILIRKVKLSVDMQPLLMNNNRVCTSDNSSNANEKTLERNNNRKNSRFQDQSTGIPEAVPRDPKRRNSYSESVILCHRCSSPITPPDKDEGLKSQYHTPSRTPVTIRKPTADVTREHKEEDSVVPAVKREGINYYPKCDPTIWIRSCTQEVIQPLHGVKSGEVPKWLRGALIRNGPGRVQVGDYQYNHVFDGSALLHRFHFRDGEVTYQNKFLESRSFLRDTRAQRIVVNYFGTRAHPDPCKTILQNIASKFTLEEHFTDNAQISLYPYGDGLYALTETPFMYRVDPDTLNTHEKVDLTKHIAVFTHTAHPHVDRDGTVYNIGQGVGPLGPRYHICKFPKAKKDAKGKVKTPFEQGVVVGSVGARWLLNPCYMHSFAMTDNYWIIIEQPLVVSVAKILKVLVRHDALIDALQWWEKETKIHVVRRDTGRVTTTQYVTETFFFLHTINAYEDRDHIVLDIAAYKNAEMLHCMFVDALKNAAYDPTYAQMFRGRPKRWVLPLKPDKDAGPHTNLVTLPGTVCRGRWVRKNVVHVSSELLADIGCEVPRINYEVYNGRPYRYFYAICSDVDHPSPGTLVKVDVVNKRHQEWSEDNVYPSEPIFIPSPNAQKEDDGVVLSALLRAEGRDCEVCLLVLDASTFTEVARVEFRSPGPVPKCLHGWFVQEGSLTVDNQRQKMKEGIIEKQGNKEKVEFLERMRDEKKQ